MSELYYDFSTVYDECKVNEFSITLGKSILEYFDDAHPSEVFKKNLDLCCGTGTLCKFFKDNGIETKGVDLSSGMLNVATRKYPDIEFIHCDAVEYEDSDTYDFITCVHDSLNHITEEEKVEKLFKNVSRFLRKDGLFIFDVLFSYNLALGDYEKYVMDNSKLKYHCELNDDLFTIETEYYEGDKLIWEDESPERIYSIERLIEILNEEGFTLELCSQSFYEETTDYKIKIIARKIN